MAGFQQDSSIDDNSGAGPSGPDSFDAVVNNTPQAASLIGPPKTPEERTQREVGWQGLISEAKNNPAIGMALLHMGAALAAPRAIGVSKTSHLLSSVAGGFDAYAALNRDQEDQGLKVDEQGRKQQATDSESKLQTAQTGQVQSTTKSIDEKTRQLQESFPLELDKLRGEIGNAKTIDQLRAAQSRAHDVQTDILKAYGGDEAKAKIALAQAQSVHALAGAELQKKQGVKIDEEIGILKDSQKGYAWTAQQDKTTGDWVRSGYNKSTGELMTIRDKTGMPLPDAIAAAKADIKAVMAQAGGFFSGGPDKADLLKQFGGATDEKTAIMNKAAEYQKGGVIVQRYKNGQLVGQDFKDNDSHSRDIGMAPETPQQANVYVARLQEIGKLQQGGQHPELDAEAARIGSALTKAGVQFDTRTATQGGTGTTPPPDAMQAAKDNKGKSGTYEASDGSKWRIEANGKIAPFSGAMPAKPQAPVQTQPQAQAATGADVINGVIQQQQQSQASQLFAAEIEQLKGLRASAATYQQQIPPAIATKDTEKVTQLTAAFQQIQGEALKLEAKLKVQGIQVP